MNDRITITIDRRVHQKLKQNGKFGETYSELLSRMIESLDSINVKQNGAGNE